MYNPFSAIKTGQPVQIPSQLLTETNGVGSSVWARTIKDDDNNLSVLVTNGSFMPAGGNKIFIAPGYSIVMLLPGMPGYDVWRAQHPDLDCFLVKVPGNNYLDAFTVSDNLVGHAKLVEGGAGKADTLVGEIFFDNSEAVKCRIVALDPTKQANKENPSFAVIYIPRTDYQRLSKTPYSNAAKSILGKTPQPVTTTNNKEILF